MYYNMLTVVLNVLQCQISLVDWFVLRTGEDLQVPSRVASHQGRGYKTLQEKKDVTLEAPVGRYGSVS